MSAMNASIFGVVAALIVGGTDYAMAMKKHVGQEYGLSSHIAYRLSGLLPGSGVAKALPPAPTGWAVRNGLPEDSLRITGKAFDPEKLATAVAIKEKMQAAMPGMQTEDRVYQKGDAEIFLNISFVPSNMMDSKEGRVTKAMFSSIYDTAQTVAESGDAALVFRKVLGPDTGHATAYVAPTDGQIFVSALSTANEKDTLALLAGIDHGVLQMLVINDPTIGKAPGAVGDDATAAAVTCVQKGAAKFCSAKN